MTPEEKYFIHTRPEMVSLVPNHAQRILDVGCSEGYFGQALKSRSEVEVWGIEPYAAAAEEAKKRIDHVLEGPVEAHIDQLPNHYFDVITCNDVLEHMVNPFKILETFHAKLAPGGCVVASLPNMRYWEALVQLVFQKDWHYTSCGTLDRTHLRFFTEKSIRRMFEEAGYQIHLLKGINQFGNHRRFPFHWATMGWGFGWLRDTSYLQFACIATPLPKRVTASTDHPIAAPSGV